MKVNWILVKEELCLIASHLSLGVRVVVAEKTQLSVNKVKHPTKEWSFFFLWILPADRGINDGKRNGRQQSFVAWLLFWVEHSKAPLTNVTVTMHSDYRLRCPIGFLNVQKKSKSKRLFLTEWIPKSKKFALFVKIMTQILYQKYFVTFLVSKYGQNHCQCSENVEGGLSKGWFLVWWPCQGKKLKIASFTEAPFMVKLDF